MTGPTSSYLQGCLDRLRAGDVAAREDLLAHSQQRLRTLTGRMLARFPNVRRWEDTDDVLQHVLLKLDQLLAKVEVTSMTDYLRLAARNIRWVLIDLARHYFGPQGMGSHHVSPPPAPLGSDNKGPPEPATETWADSRTLAVWGDFHEQAARLPDDDGAVFDLLWYHGMSQDEAAEVLGISLSTVKRRWQAARLRLIEAFGGSSPF